MIGSLDPKANQRDKWSIHCVVVPRSVVSVYDHNVKFKGTINDIEEYLNSKIKDNLECISTNSAIDDVDYITELIERPFQRARNGKAPAVVIVVDRTVEAQHIYFGRLSVGQQLEELFQNQLISMKYLIDPTNDTENNSIKTWLCFGNRQTIRFWPEQLVWFIPRLFVIDTADGAEYLKKIYDNHYRHGFRFKLDDPVFNKYYKILTGFDHESVNYYRSEAIQQRMEYKEFWSQKLDDGTLRFLDSNGFDSDSVFADIAVAVGGDEDDSNVVTQIREHTQNEEQFQNTIISLYDYTKKSRTQCTINNVLEIWDCQFVKELIGNLRKFQDENFEIKAGNVSGFDVSAAIRGLDHLVTVHNLYSIQNKQKIRCFIGKQIRCRLGDSCTAFVHQCSRRREKTINDSATVHSAFPGSDEVHSLINVTMNNLSAAHCYLLHSDDILYRRSGESAKFEANPFSTTVLLDDNEEKKGDDDDVDAPMSIDWGKHILQWLPFGVHPHFGSFMEEMLRNPASTLNEELMGLFEAECKVKMEEAKSRGIVFTKEEILCLKLYSDTNQLQAELRRAHWRRTPLDIKRNFYNWAITMYRTFLFHSVPTIELTLYHGLNQMFMVDDVSPLYNGPFSTTSVWNVAHSFSNGNGLLFTVGINHLNPLKLIMGIDMKSISCHPNEHEVLLYSQTIPIKNTKAFESGDDSLIDHLMFSLKKMKEPITNKLDFYRKIGTKFKNKWTESILNHRQLFSVSAHGGRIVAHRLLHELDVLGHQMSVEYSDYKMTPYLFIKKEQNISVRTLLRVHPVDSKSRKTAPKIIENDGVIILESSGDIENDGKISCVLPSGHSINGGTAYLFCDGALINSGDIECSPNGRVIARCSEFVNDGNIDSEPFILIDSAKETQSLIMEQLQWVICCGQHLVFDGADITVRHGMRGDIDSEISKLAFTISIDHDQWGKKQVFKNSMYCRVPFASSALYKNGESVTLRIYAKPKDIAFPPILCKSVKWTKPFARYRLRNDEPLIIDKRLDVLSVKMGQKQQRTVSIQCAGNFMIGTNGVIDTLNDDGNDKNICGEICLQTAGHFANHGILRCNESGGGVITVFAVDGVRNNGIMECGGTMIIVTDGEFVNNGVIECGQNGRVIIECSDLVNNGSITPIPDVVFGKQESTESLNQRMDSMIDDGPIKLTVKKHRGHYIWRNKDIYHPQNLLNEGTRDCYWSDDKCGPPNEDWIVFEHDEESRFIPTTVIIRNDRWSGGIKRIAIYGGNNIDDLEEWIEIDGIHNEGKLGNEESIKRQIFPIALGQRYIAYFEQFKYFKLRVLENHGGSWNVFYEFAILGVRLQ